MISPVATPASLAGNRGMKTRFVTGGAMAGAVGGGLRIAAAFIPYTPGQPWLEALYAVIDIGMMFGLLAAWLFAAEAVGRIGLGGFAVALTGLASIVGPDSHAFGIDFYMLGASVFMLGLTVLAIQLVRRRTLVVAGWLWLVAATAGAVFALAAAAPALIASGAALGLGFVAAARAIRR
ncbi:MAG TPA: hypothetical protein VK980_19090 [Sphingomonas sp.]|nr:hypothetical protein [Sphingomonas sp.]